MREASFILRRAGSRVLALRTTEGDELLKGATWIVDDLSKVTLGAAGTGQRLTLTLRT